MSPIDSALLGFYWENKYYSKRYLPFGLRTAPFLFNLFAEGFHWILGNELEKENLQAEIIHYLHDFLIILPSNQNLKAYSQRFCHLCSLVGLTIKVAKNEEGKVATFRGVELDTDKMLIRWPTKKLEKARIIVESALAATSLSLIDLQRITGFLNFVTVVVPLGRTFLRWLYNMELHFPEHRMQGRNCRRRITREAYHDLKWWQRVLARAPEWSIQQERRDTVALWSDASGTKGLGAFYTRPKRGERGGKSSPNSNPETRVPVPGHSTSISLPCYLNKNKEHINTKEMRAVEQALLLWGKEWCGCKVIMHIDNRAVAYAISNRTIRGATMSVLRHCLLIAAECDLEIEFQWISTKQNTLADALSRFDFDRITNLAPQLIHPTSSLRDCRFLIYNKQGSSVSQHTTFGVA